MKWYQYLGRVGCIALFCSASGVAAVDPLTKAEPVDYMDIPSARKMESLVKASCTPQAHPRLMLIASDIEVLKARVGTDPILSEAWKKVRATADNLLRAPVQTTSAVRRATLHRMYDLGLAYHLTGEEKYAMRAIQEMEAVAALPTWYHTGKRDFLGTGYFTKGMAIGYDWFYNAMTPVQRKVVRAAIIEKGLRLGMICYENPTDWEYANKHWVRGAHNWNPTCNGGMIMGALAIAEDEPELAGKILNYGLRSLGVFLPVYAPDGAWPEGVMYWYYAANSLIEVTDSLQSALGSDFGISKTPGLDRTGRFTLFMNGPNGGFNWGDAGPERRISEELFWLADNYEDATLQSMYLAMRNGGSSSHSRLMLWYRPMANVTVKIPMAEKFGGTESVGMSTGWTDPNAVYCAVKGGKVPESHGTMSLGTFVLDAGGERWVQQLGPDDYALPGYWDSSPRAGQRWTYYRMRAEGQNTLASVMEYGADQKVPSEALITGFETGEDGCFVTIDMTETFPTRTVSAERRVSMTPTGRVTVEDRAVFKSPRHLSWGVHTSASVDLRDEGRLAVLSQHGKTMRVRIESPDGRFTVRPAAPRPRSDLPNKEGGNSGVQRLEIDAPSVTNLGLSVSFELVKN